MFRTRGKHFVRGGSDQQGQATSPRRSKRNQPPFSSLHESINNTVGTRLDCVFYNVAALNQREEVQDRRPLVLYLKQ